ncbi:hypothetical protein BYT27DRAFT_6433244 [Phlegmacium glaucopus]|nr:hypothetical protein BYT27DRAFT_6433244 [Phlegmacium glaucopus]
MRVKSRGFVRCCLISLPSQRRIALFQSIHPLFYKSSLSTRTHLHFFFHPPSSPYSFSLSSLPLVCFPSSPYFYVFIVVTLPLSHIAIAPLRPIYLGRSLQRPRIRLKRPSSRIVSAAEVRLSV